MLMQTVPVTQGQVSLGNWHYLHEYLRDGVSDSVCDGKSDDDGVVINVFKYVLRKNPKEAAGIFLIFFPGMVL